MQRNRPETASLQEGVLNQSAGVACMMHLDFEALGNGEQEAEQFLESILKSPAFALGLDPGEVIMGQAGLWGGGGK
jgi:hypothetical protein